MAPSTRTSRTQAAILDAAAWIMRNQGAAAVTPQAVALRAGVGRATVYRHWPDGSALVQAALERVDLQIAEPEDSPLEQRLVGQLHLLANELNASQTRRMLSILLERAERLRTAELLRQRIVDRFLDELDRALDLAVERGELHGRPDAGHFFDQLVGPLWSQRMLRGIQISGETIEQTVRGALQPWR